MRRPPSADPRDRIPRRALIVLVATLTTAACSSLPKAAGPPSPPPSANLPSPPVAGPPVAPDPDRDAAMARWAAVEAVSHGYTVESTVDGLASTTDHLISIEGHPERVPIRTSSFAGWSDEQLTIPGMFELIRAIRGRPGTIEATYDPVLGYPATIRREDTTSSDGSWSMRVVEFRSAQDAAPTDGGLATRLERARAAWDRWAPSDYAYEWQMVPVGGGATGVGWSIRHDDEVTTATALFGDTAAIGRDAASIPATFDAIEAASERGAWVDAVFDRVLGLPILVGIDPTPAVGDGFWLKIAFHDIVAETGRADLLAARERWATNRPDRYSYVWRQVDGDRRRTYRVQMHGDVATIRPSGGAPTGEAATLAPRIDDLFLLIDEVLANGGHVDATYDPELGYPTRVTIAGPDTLVGGTITIRSVVVDATR